MSEWDDRIQYNRRWVDLHKHNPYQAEAARRLTVVLNAMEALLSDEVIEQAARALYWSNREPGSGLDPQDYLIPEVREYYRGQARVALEAAIEGEGEQP